MTATLARPVTTPAPTVSRPRRLVVEDLHVHYGATHALRGVSFEAREGEILGILGRNGAGKTTLVETIEGLRRPTSGRATVQGFDSWRDRRRVHESVGVQLQITTLPPDERVGSLVAMFRRLYRSGITPTEALSRVGLSQRAGIRIRALSGGERQRVALALALVNGPSLLILDEPTTGLDPLAKRQFWDVLRAFRDDGGTILMTTHLMDEAEALCDQLVVIKEGTLVRTGRPSEVIRAESRAAIRFTLPVALPASQIASALAAHISSAPALVSCECDGDGVYHARGHNSDDLLLALGVWANSLAVRPADIRISTRSLEDVYLELVEPGGATTGSEGASNDQ